MQEPTANTTYGNIIINSCLIVRCDDDESFYVMMFRTM
jgi:hypothetical protein